MFVLLKKYFQSQAGIAQLVVLLLLVAGIAAGTYIVQQQVNIIPKAFESSNTSHIAVIPPIKEGVASYRYEPDISGDNEAFISRQVNESLCGNQCTDIEQVCTHSEYFGANSSRPGNAGRYACYSNAYADEVISGSEDFNPAEYTIVGYDKCNNFCNASESCVVAFAAPTDIGKQHYELIHNNYIFACLSDSYIRSLPQDRFNNELEPYIISGQSFYSDNVPANSSNSKGRTWVLPTSTGVQAGGDTASFKGASSTDPTHEPYVNCYKDIEEGKVPFYKVGLGQVKTTPDKCEDLIKSHVTASGTKVTDAESSIKKMRDNTVDDSTKGLLDKAEKLAKEADDAIKKATEDPSAENSIAAALAAQKVNVAKNLAKYNEIINGAPDKCVKADLGVSPVLVTPGIAHFDDEPLFLLICSSKDATKDDPKLRWRVLTLSGTQERLAILFPKLVDQIKTDPTKKAEILCEVDKGFDKNCANANVEPDFSKAVITYGKGESLKLEGQTKAQVVVALSKWVEAAKAGKISLD